MRRVSSCWLVCFALIVLAVLMVPAGATTPRLNEASAREEVLKWIDGYRGEPDPASVPMAMKVLSRRGLLQDPDTAGVYVGFMAGVIGAHPDAEGLIGKVLPALAEEDQWIMVRAIAYSGLPDWKALMSKFAARMPSRSVMIAKYLDGTLPALEQVPLETDKPALLDKMKGFFGSGTPKHSALTFDSSPELLDTLWGIYFATGNYRPVSRIIAMLPWSKEQDSVAKLTVGGMAKYTLVSNATRSRDLLAMLKRASRHEQKSVVPILNEVIEAAETMDGARVRKESLAAIEELKTKGPGYKREVSLWGKVGQGALAVGCIAAAAVGQVELGLPCVIGGATSSAALSAWDGQK
jgi:hypothetical protein